MLKYYRGFAEEIVGNLARSGGDFGEREWLSVEEVENKRGTDQSRQASGYLYPTTPTRLNHPRLEYVSSHGATLCAWSGFASQAHRARSRHVLSRSTCCRVTESVRTVYGLDRCSQAYALHLGEKVGNGL